MVLEVFLKRKDIAAKTENEILLENFFEIGRNSRLRQKMIKP